MKQSQKSGLFSYFRINDVVEEHRKSYAEMILVELEQDKALKESAAKIREKLEKGELIDLAMMLHMEYEFISKLSGTALDAKLESAIMSLRNLSGDHSANGWVIKWTTLHNANSDENQKKEFLKSVLREIFNVYQSGITLERVKFGLFLISGLAFFIVLLGLIALFEKAHQVVWLLFIFGLCGAFVSIFQRISCVSTTSRGNTKDLIALVHAPYGLLVSLAFGSAFPLVAALLISSGSIHSSLFPRIDSVSDLRISYSEYEAKYNSSAAKEMQTHLKTNSDGTGGLTSASPPEDLEHLGNLNFDRNFAKLLMLAFFSGFSERFISDAIDSFSKRISKGQSKNTDSGTSA